MTKPTLNTTVISDLAWEQLTNIDAPANNPVASTVAGVAPVQSWEETDQVLPDIGQVDNELLAAAGLSNTILISVKTEEVLKTITVSIGDNGNWFVGGVDTGVAAQGTNEASIARPTGVYGAASVFHIGNTLTIGAGLMYCVKEGQNFFTMQTTAELNISIDASTTFVTIDRTGTVRTYSSGINLWTIPESQALVALVIDTDGAVSSFAVPTVHNAMLMASAVIPYSRGAIEAASTATLQATVASQFAGQARQSAEAAEASKIITQADAATTTANAQQTEQWKNDAQAAATSAHQFADFADADRVATAADRAQVAADKAAVSADRSTVATYKGIVASDKAITLGYKNDADASKNLAAEYAIKPEDSIITGTVSDYSALHWAQKAQQWAQAVSSALVWKGQWSAAGNTAPPTPVVGSGAHFYRISGAGVISGTDYAVGDYIHWDLIGKVWFKIDGTDAVVSVNGKSPIGGNVVLASSDVGAASVNDVYPKDATYTKHEVNELGWQRVEDLRGFPRAPLDFRDRTISAWFNDQGNPTGGWYSGINIRGWADTCADWQLLSGSDIPATQSADKAKTALWFRTGSGAGWGEFQKVYTTKHKPTPAEIGAIPTNTANGTPVAAYYTDAVMVKTGTKIRLPFNVTSVKMVSFTVRVYQDYQTADIQFSGYLYSEVNNWYEPRAIMIAGSSQVYYAMGRDDDGRAYVWIGGGYYRGVGVFDVVGGYAQADWNAGWEISVSDHKPNLAMEGAVYPPYSPANKPNAREIGAAPDGFGVGGYCADISTVLGDCNLRRQGGFFQGSNIEGMPTEGRAYKYVINLAHPNSAGYFGYIAMDFDLNHAWLGGQSGGSQRQKKFVFQADRFIAAGAIGSDYNNSSIEVVGSGGGIKPAIGFHQPSEFAGSIALWGASDFRFLIQGLSDYAGILTGNVNANDVYIRSDARLKTNFSEIKDALSRLKALTGYFYDKKGTLKSTNYDKHEFGLIAQDVERVLPEAIHRHVDSNSDDNEEVLSISGSAISALIVEAIKELDSRLTAAGI